MQGVSFVEFQQNREKLLAIVKLLEIIGEAVKQYSTRIAAHALRLDLVLLTTLASSIVLILLR
ncbi:HepT-like ribonuclease domain-containing protein [Spirulina major]|uniref:HepT-like ribonuclease domain-containing protein n=1 Tax=Spirulina major TaxID=270636 RepID=UPI003CCBF6B6